MRTGRRRRRRLEGGQKRENRVTIYLNDEEKALLERYEDATDCTAGFILVAALRARSDTFERINTARHASAELAVTNRLLANATNNLNQIAHAANIDGEVDVERLARVCAEITEQRRKIAAHMTEVFG